MGATSILGEPSNTIQRTTLLSLLLQLGARSSVESPSQTVTWLRPSIRSRTTQDPIPISASAHSISSTKICLIIAQRGFGRAKSGWLLPAGLSIVWCPLSCSLLTAEYCNRWTFQIELTWCENPAIALFWSFTFLWLGILVHTYFFLEFKTKQNKTYARVGIHSVFTI